MGAIHCYDEEVRIFKTDMTHDVQTVIKICLFCRFVVTFGQHRIWIKITQPAQRHSASTWSVVLKTIAKYDV